MRTGDDRQTAFRILRHCHFFVIARPPQLDCSCLACAWLNARAAPGPDMRPTATSRLTSRAGLKAPRCMSPLDAPLGYIADGAVGRRTIHVCPRQYASNVDQSATCWFSWRALASEGSASLPPTFHNLRTHAKLGPCGGIGKTKVLVRKRHHHRVEAQCRSAATVSAMSRGGGLARDTRKRGLGVRSGKVFQDQPLPSCTRIAPRCGGGTVCTVAPFRRVRPQGALSKCHKNQLVMFNTGSG